MQKRLQNSTRAHICALPLLPTCPSIPTSRHQLSQRTQSDGNLSELLGICGRDSAASVSAPLICGSLTSAGVQHAVRSRRPRRFVAPCLYAYLATRFARLVALVEGAAYRFCSEVRRGRYHTREGGGFTNARCFRDRREVCALTQ